MSHEQIRAAMEAVLQELADADSLARTFYAIEETPPMAEVYCAFLRRLSATWEPLETLLRREVLVEAGDRGGTPQVLSSRLSS